MFRIIGEFVEGFDSLTGIEPAITIYGSARLKQDNPLYSQTQDIAFRLGELGFSIVTGGGGGVMEAANKGARAAGVSSVGLNIELPMEQTLNSYTTKSITFHHFFVRKVMLAKYATAFIILPGGLGTLDELFEILTLIQTQKVRPFPVIMVNQAYWQGLLDWLKSTVLAAGNISPEDFNLLRVCDKTEEVIETVQAWYKRHEVTGRQVFEATDV